MISFGGISAGTLTLTSTDGGIIFSAPNVMSATLASYGPAVALKSQSKGICFTATPQGSSLWNGTVWDQQEPFQLVYLFLPRDMCEYFDGIPTLVYISGNDIKFTRGSDEDATSLQLQLLFSPNRKPIMC